MRHISEQRPPVQESTSTFAGSSLLILGLAVLALMSGWGVFLYLGIGSLISPEPPPGPIPPDHPPSADYDKKEAEFVLRLQREELAARIDELESQIKLTEDLARRFDEKMAALRTSNSGRRLATLDIARKCDFLSRYAKGASSETARQELSSIKRRVETERNPFAEMNEFHATFACIQSDLETWQRKVEIARSAIDQLLRDSTVAQPRTLQDVLNRLVTADDNVVQRAVDGKLQDLSNTQMAQLKEENDRTTKLESDVQDAKLRLADAEEQARQQIDSANRSAEEAEQAREAELSQNIARLNSSYPAVRELLVPLTTPGYRQISSANRLENTADKQPLSYTGLLRTGVLENTGRGIEGLFYLMQPAAAGGLNDRPMGAFPEYRAEIRINDATTREKVKQAQEFIRIHGVAMVREGLLSE